MDEIEDDNDSSMLEVTRFPRIPSRSLEASKIIEFLKNLPEGTMVPVEKLSEVAGISVHYKDRRGYQFVASARRYLETTYGAVWEPIRGEQKYKRLGNVERVSTVDYKFNRITRSVRGAAKRVATIDIATLPESDRTPFLYQVAHVSALGACTGSKARKKIEFAKAFTEKDALAALMK